MIRGQVFSGIGGVGHAFFTREGGFSEGIYRSLNCGNGTADAPERVRANRALAGRALGVAEEALLTAHQVHSAKALAVTALWPDGVRPRIDAMATDRPGLALGVLTADCAPVLLADSRNGVVGAAHAGWKGARAGVLEAAVERMEGLGARAADIVACVGPCIQQESYEVGPEFHAGFVADDPINARYFRPSSRPGHHRFDLSRYVAARLSAIGLKAVERMADDTCADPDRFFSYRRATLLGEPDYGRALSAIVLSR